MAWTEFSHSCGHTTRVQVYGKESDRQRRIAFESQRLCRECFVERRKESGEESRPIWHVERVDSSRFEVCVGRAYDQSFALRARGYRLDPEMDPDERAFSLAQFHEVPHRYWRRQFPRALTPNEITWLESQGWAEGEVAPETDRPDRHVTHPDRLPIPAVFADVDWPFGMRDRVAEACHRIRLALDRADFPYIAFSGGKDSTVVLALVDAVRGDIPVIWSDDELEWPETVAFMEALDARLQHRFRIVEGFAEHGGWFRPWRERPFFREPHPKMEAIAMPMEEWAWLQEGYDLTFLGLRGEESQVRGDWLLGAGGTYRRRGSLVCCPIWDWDVDMLWRFIEVTGTAYNAAYDRYREIGTELRWQRIGPLPLCPRDLLAAGWPELLARLEVRYGNRW